MKRIITLSSLCSICFCIYYIYKPETYLLPTFTNNINVKSVVDKLIAPSLVINNNDSGE